MTYPVDPTQPGYELDEPIVTPTVFQGGPGQAHEADVPNAFLVDQEHPGAANDADSYDANAYFPSQATGPNDATETAAVDGSGKHLAATARADDTLDAVLDEADYAPTRDLGEPDILHRLSAEAGLADAAGYIRTPDADYVADARASVPAPVTSPSSAPSADRIDAGYPEPVTSSFEPAAVGGDVLVPPTSPAAQYAGPTAGSTQLPDDAVAHPRRASHEDTTLDDLLDRTTDAPLPPPQDGHVIAPEAGRRYAENEAGGDVAGDDDPPEQGADPKTWLDKVSDFFRG